MTYEDRLFRQAFLAAVVGAAVHFGLALHFSLGSAALAQEGEPVLLGVTLPLSGAQEALGNQQRIGAELAVEMINKDGGILGRSVELIFRDDAAKPDIGVANVNELAGLGANLMLGGVQTSVTLGIIPLLENLDSVFISTAASTATLTGPDVSDRYFRVSDNFAVRAKAKGIFMSEQLSDVTKWTGLVADARFGESAWNSFKEEAKMAYDEAGLEIEFVDPVLFSFGATDFRNQIAKLLGSPAKGIYVVANGADAITFYNQASSLGLIDQFDAVIDAGGEMLLANAMGDRVPEGLWTTSHWYHGSYVGTELGDYLLDAGTERLGSPWNVSGYIEPTFSAVLAYRAAIEKAGTTDPAVVAKALVGLAFDTPKGGVTLRAEDHQALTDVNFFRLGRKASAPGWQVTDEVVVPAEDAAIPLDRM